MLRALTALLSEEEDTAELTYHDTSAAVWSNMRRQSLHLIQSLFCINHAELWELIYWKSLYLSFHTGSVVLRMQDAGNQVC